MARTTRRRKLKVLFAASEVVPFSKTGGLGDVAGSLPSALKHVGAKVAVISPLYKTISSTWKDKMTKVGELYVPLAWREAYCGVYHLVHENVDCYFIDNEQYFGRDGLYGFFDDGERFAFFSKAICEVIAHVPELACDILHCNDWQTALAPVFLREFYRGIPECDNVRTVFSIHNVKFQGQFTDEMLADPLGLDGIPAAAGQLRCDDHSINFMQGALLYSDYLSTVSPTYALELQMPFYGEGMDPIFRRRHEALRGILNGIDTAAWSPANDPYIPAHFSAKKFEGKAECKRALQEELGLEVNPDIPLVVMVTRLTDQKGMGLVTYAMDRLMSAGMEVAILGTGDQKYEDALRYFNDRYGNHMAARLQFDVALSHRMYAGADMFLMPSEFEPCGLSQMISMRYGTLPIVRETGGLADSVQAYNQYTQEGTGFSFANMNADEMADVVCYACDVYWNQKDAWNALVANAMAADFSWHTAANDYLDMYHWLHPEVIRYTRRRDW